MAPLKSEEKKIHVDDKGYLADDETWNEDVALALAREEGITCLSKGQLEIIRELRAYYVKYRVFPILDNICRIAHQRKECVQDQFVNPEIAWKIAGLPKQDGVHFVTMDGAHFFMEPYC